MYQVNWKFNFVLEFIQLSVLFFIDEVPLGYSFYARENADATHKIVIDPDAPGTDMYIVFNEIFNLIKVSNASF